VVVLPLKVGQRLIGLQVVTSKHLPSLALVINRSAPGLKVGQVSGAKQQERDGVADENTKS